MNKETRFAGTLTACIVLSLSTGACAKRQPPPARPPSTVQTLPAARMDVPIVLETFGMTDEGASVDIVPQVSGVLTQTFITDGAVVTNGQPLFQIDPSDYAMRVRQAEGLVAAQRAALELSRITLTRNEPLLEKKLISNEGFDMLRTQRDAAAAQLQISEAALDQARLNLARCTVTSPLAGICSKRYLDNGNLATAGLSKLTNIRSYDPLFVEFSLPEQHVPLLRQALAGGEVRLTVRPRGETNTYSGSLEFIDNAVNSLAGTILLRGRVPNADLKLWARQFVTVTVFAGQVSDAVMVPEGAIQFGKRGTHVFTVSKENLTELRPVKTGIRFNNLIQIVEGVAPQDKVVVLGQLMLFPGAPVKEAGPAAPPAATGKPGVK
jgi:multidrug efflux system membrane fusion protein